MKEITSGKGRSLKWSSLLYLLELASHSQFWAAFNRASYCSPLIKRSFKWLMVQRVFHCSLAKLLFLFCTSLDKAKNGQLACAGYLSLPLEYFSLGNHLNLLLLSSCYSHKEKHLYTQHPVILLLWYWGWESLHLLPTHLNLSICLPPVKGWDADVQLPSWFCGGFSQPLGSPSSSHD